MSSTQTTYLMSGSVIAPAKSGVGFIRILAFDASEAGNKTVLADNFAAGLNKALEVYKADGWKLSGGDGIKFFIFSKGVVRLIVRGRRLENGSRAPIDCPKCGADWTKAEYEDWCAQCQAKKNPATAPVATNGLSAEEKNALALAAAKAEAEAEAKAEAEAIAQEAKEKAEAEAIAQEAVKNLIIASDADKAKTAKK